MVISDAPLRPTFELRPQKIFAAITPIFELKLLLGGALKITTKMKPACGTELQVKVSSV